MARAPMPLEALGLLCLLEKVGDNNQDMDALARHGLLQEGFITEGTVPALTPRGKARLEALRRWRENGKPGAAGQ